MKPKFLALTVILFTVLSIGLISTLSKVRHSKQEPSRNRIQWHIDQAKAEHRNRVTIDADVVEYMGSASQDIDEALATYTLVTAVPIASRSYETDTGILTWYKFRTVEYLTDIRTPPCLECNSLKPPTDMLPLSKDEFLLPKQGGTITRDGVQVTEIERSFPFLNESQKYMMFISLYPSGVALTAGGAIGIFSVRDDESLVALNDESHKLKDGVKQKFHSSLREAKTKLKN
jgi:hypothetical protein